MTRYRCPACGKQPWRESDTETLKSWCQYASKDVLMTKVSKAWPWWRRLWT